MPSRSLRQRSSGVLSIGAVVCLALASVAAFAAEAAAGRISKCTKITEPGSYVLTRNLAAAGSCIVVAADFVTIDLGGWVITGPGDTGAGVTDEGNPRQGIALRNGVVTGFNDSVRFGSSGAVVEKVRASAFETGIAVGADGIVSGNTVSSAVFGIVVGPNSIVSDNIVRGGDFYHPRRLWQHRQEQRRPQQRFWHWRRPRQHRDRQQRRRD